MLGLGRSCGSMRLQAEGRRGERSFVRHTVDNIRNGGKVGKPPSPVR